MAGMTYGCLMYANVCISGSISEHLSIKFGFWIALLYVCAYTYVYIT